MPGIPYLPSQDYPAAAAHTASAAAARHVRLVAAVNPEAERATGRDVVMAPALPYGAELWTHDEHFRGLRGNIHFVELDAPAGPRAPASTATAAAPESSPH